MLCLASTQARRLRLSLRPPSGLLPSRSVGPEPEMINTTGTGASDFGSNIEPYNSPLPVSRLSGRCRTEAWTRPVNRERLKTRTRSIIAPSWTRCRLDSQAPIRFEDELLRQPAYTGAFGFLS